VDVFYLGNPAIADLGFRAIVLLPSGTVQVWRAEWAGHGRGSVKVQSGNIMKQVASWPSSKVKRARGFSLVEMLIATVILLVGLVGIAQLVPASILINQKGRLNSTSLVFAQRELDQMLAHRLTDTSFQEANGVFCAGSFCSLGDASTPGPCKEITFCGSSTRSR